MKKEIARLTMAKLKKLKQQSLVGRRRQIAPLCVLVMGFVFFQPTGQAATAIGNGGDLVENFLNSTRYALREVLMLTAQQNDGFKKVCSQAFDSELRQKSCIHFLKLAAPQILKMTQDGPSRVEFVISSEPLTVRNPGGGLREVAARTPLGPQGTIEFHLASVRFLAPQAMLALMIHEFGHKVELSGKSIHDEGKVAGFNSGREFLDQMGLVLAGRALELNLIGGHFQVLEHFSCEVKRSSGTVDVFESATPRRFVKTNNFEDYSVSIGIDPGDMKIKIGETSQSWLELRVLIREKNGCRELNSTGVHRMTNVALWRTSKSVGPSDSPSKSQKVQQRFNLGQNPVCESSLQKHFEISAPNLSVSCLHLGTEALAGGTGVQKNEMILVP